jgi:diadenosine tetraphosphatase ApaH/serine/threonine PP2A family protein phosphatase|uniref:Metallophosphoesterase n=1 Tax=Desulfobacca acetoxidans TaxID=60893 RepID=A0A7C5EN93_9BACT
MRLALISDIHSNIQALEQVMAALRRERVDQVLNLGDVVGYNANPNECLELILEWKVLSLAGNHDLALLDPDRARRFNLIAYQAIVWSREQVRPEFQEYLQTLPLVLEGPGYLACHGTPTSTDHYISYHFQGKAVFNTLRALRQQVCFFGHTHRRALWYRDVRGKVATLPVSPEKIRLEPSWHYLINPGSVGQPRDGNPDAAYAIFDDEEFSIHFKSVPYDIAAAQRCILKAGLPDFLAERLVQGI